MNRTLAFAVVSGVALSLASVGFAEPPQQADPMRGPDVHDRQVPGVSGSFGQPGGDKRRFANENKLPPRVFRDAMETVLNPEAPDDLRVTDEQRTRYRGWMDDFQKSVQAYMKEHAGELAELRKRGGEPGKRPKGQGPENTPAPMDDSDKPADGKDAGAARERMQSLMAGAPKIEDLYTKIWSELTPAQQRAVDGKLDDFRTRQAKEREDRYVEQRTKKKVQPGQDAPKPPQGDKANPPRRPGVKPQDGAPARPDANAPRPDGAPQRGAQMDPQRRDRLMRIFARLTPEQQDQLLQRLEQRVRDEGGENDAPPAPQGRRQRGPRGPDEPRPAPQQDDSMTPSSEPR